MLKVSVFASFVCEAAGMLRTFCSMLLFVKNMFLSDCQKNQNTDSDSLSPPNICPSLTFCQNSPSLINTAAAVLTGQDLGRVKCDYLTFRI